MDQGNPRVNGPTQVVEVHGGHRMRVHIGGDISPSLIATGEYHPKMTACWERLLREDMIVVDVGAHVGYFSLLAAKKVGPKGRVYAFEPEESNYRLLEENIELNGYHNIIAYKLAISNKRGQGGLVYHGWGNGGHWLSRNGGGQPVTVVRLDDILQTKIDICKIDTEGHEVDVFEGMADLLKANRLMKLFVEYLPHGLIRIGRQPHILIDMLIEQGFEIEDIGESHWLEGKVNAERLDIRYPPDKWTNLLAWRLE